MASADSTLTVGPATLATLGTPSFWAAPEVEQEVEAMAGSDWLVFAMAACDWLLSGAPSGRSSLAPGSVAWLSHEASATRGNLAKEAEI